MQKIIDEIASRLNDELKKFDEKAPDQAVKTDQSIQCVAQCLKQLKEYICANPFQSKEEEIHFFKVTKPTIFSKLIFLIDVFNIETRCPPGNARHRKKYLLKVQKRLLLFFKENVDFYTYYRGQSTHLDEKYFLRCNPDYKLNIDSFTFDADPCFSTNYDFKVAKIMANDRLNSYLNKELQNLHLTNKQPPGENKKHKHTWTESKIALTELIYALHASGSINNGHDDIKEIAFLFESVFNIELGDVYRTFLEIKNRLNPTKFIDILHAALSKKINEQHS